MHILCTDGTPIVDTLDHLPPIPLSVHYRRFAPATLTRKDELGIYHALQLRDRLRRIALRLPPSTLLKFLMLMDEPFPILENLSLSFQDDRITSLIIPKNFLAPNLRHLALHGIGLPKGLSSLSSTTSLVTLALTNIRSSRYFLPGELMARLRSHPQLEKLEIEFSVPIPRPSAERELLGEQQTPVTLPNLKYLEFQGVSAYLDCLVAQIRAPSLERLKIKFFHQMAFTLPHLSHLLDTTERLKLPTAKIFFEHDGVAIGTADRSMPRFGPFLLRVLCKPLDWQIDCAAQICSALIPPLSGVEQLTLYLYEETMPTEWQNGEIDGTSWHELLRSFVGVKELHICDSLSEELSRALKLDEIGSDPGLLPHLQELVSGFKGLREPRPFGSFLSARRLAGRPLRSSFPHLRRRPI
jgi:hypothetical protein